MNRLFIKLVSAIIVISLLLSFAPFAVSAKDTDIFYGKSRLALMERGSAYVEAYERIYDTIENRGSTADLQDLELTEDELKCIFSAYSNDPTGHFWISRYSYSYWSPEKVISFMPVYNDLAGKNNEEFEYNRKVFNDAANEIIKKAGIKKNMTEFEKEHLIHDVLIGQTQYVNSEYSHSSYGALVNHEAVCDGYSKAFQYLMRLCGIQAHMVSGYANGGAHAWNLVRIDGNYYYADITWDDPLGGDEDEEDFFHSYFNVTSNYLKNDHVWQEPLYGLPDCTSSSANLYTVDPQRTVDCNCNLVTIASLFHNGHAYIHIADNASQFCSWFFQNSYAIAELAGYDTTKPLRVSYTNMNDEYRLSIKGTLLPTDNDPDEGTPTDPVRGDIDGDNKVTAIDANFMKRIISGSHSPSDSEYIACDINEDDAVDVRDANLIKRLLAGIM